MVLAASRPFVEGTMRITEGARAVAHAVARRALSGLRRRGRALAGDRRGNVALITGFCLVPLIGALGCATDYGMALAYKAKLDRAADAAAIAAITGVQTYILNYTGVLDPTSAAIASAKTQAQAQFNANLGALPSTAPVPTIQITALGLTVSAKVSYSLSMPTLFMKYLGTSTSALSGSSATTLTMPGFNNIYIIIDTSSSMGIGATQADQQIVYTATNGCAVACHYTGTTTTARNAGATLRIDVAKQSVIAALNQMISTGNTNRFKVAIYTFSSQFKSVFPLSSDLQGAIAAVGGIELSAALNDGGTNSTYGLKSLNTLLPVPGTGLTSLTPQGTVMFITDGVQDSDIKVTSNGSQDGYDSNFTPWSPCTQANCNKYTQFAVPIYIQSLDPSACSAMKTKGYTVMTLNTRYIVPAANLRSSSAALNTIFDYIQANLLSSISSNMAACATSSADAYAASTPAEINTAVAKMFAATGALARITQ
ncbi:TadE/TadG family type IV pilus assembly protein [Methylobacterium nonmethylotrophicum]|nr:vWA domain-containing protein [Methylobacterium nonmethylotrophicum]